MVAVFRMSVMLVLLTVNCYKPDGWDVSILFIVHAVLCSVSCAVPITKPMRGYGYGYGYMVWEPIPVLMYAWVHGVGTHT